MRKIKRHVNSLNWKRHVQQIIRYWVLYIKLTSENIFWQNICFFIASSQANNDMFSIWNAINKVLYCHIAISAWKVSKYGVFSGPYFPAFGQEKTPYIDTFHAVHRSSFFFYGHIGTRRGKSQVRMKGEIFLSKLRNSF